MMKKLFAGSGKTYTMCGDGNGIIPKTIDTLFEHFEMQKQLGWNFEMNIACVKLSDGKWYDLNGAEISAIERFENATTKSITSGFDVPKFLESVLNESIERSHLIVQLKVSGQANQDQIRSVINLIDTGDFENVTAMVNAIVDCSDEGIAKLVSPKECHSLATSTEMAEKSANALSALSFFN